MNKFNFKPAKKYRDHGVTRVVPPQTTVRRVSRLLEKFGVTRISDITQLDYVGIPTFISVRPKDKGPGISYYNGKGTTRIESHAGAIMEALERFCGESHFEKPIFDNFNNLKLRSAAIDPKDLIVPTLIEYDDDLPIEWVEGFDLLQKKTVYVPLNLVVCPYTPGQGKAVYYANTNGLASGNCMEEAVCHALCEVIERDSSSIVQAKLELLPTINNVLRELNLNGGYTDTNEFPLISKTGLPLKAARLIGKINRSGLKIYLRNITTHVGIPTIDATIVEGTHIAHGGTGTHPDATIALTRAITEAAQSRLAHIQGGREDLTDLIRESVPKLDPEIRYGKGKEIAFSSIKTYCHKYINDDINFILGKLKIAGFQHVIAVDMTKKSLNIPVVRIIIPQAETWSVFSLHVKRGVFGRRLKKMLSDFG
jgi:ribosomal protein S12 methylthiotransferase accessory factor